MRNVIFLSSFFLASNCSLIFAAHQDIDIFLHDSCAEEISGNNNASLKMPKECFNAFTPHMANKLIIDDLPNRIRDWGSNGRGGKPWHFVDEECDNFFSSLFFTIPHIYKNINLSPHDLFHAHIINYNNNKFALVFHAKEYPLDLEHIKNNYQSAGERFSSADNSFTHRNFIAVINNDKSSLYAVKNFGTCRQLFQRGRGNALDEQRIAQMTQGKISGDINVFMMENVNRIKYQFYQGFREGLGIINDLEALETGKSAHERLWANGEIDRFISKARSKRPIIYFLTGIL